MGLRRFTVVFIAVSVGAGLILAIAIDRVVGLFLLTGLIYGPHERVHYRTPEFDVVATTNSLGLRDRELGPVALGVWRLLVVGDSFTYGWGVASEETWPRVLEAELTRRGLPVEVINAGAVGGSPLTYAEVIERTVPVLRPHVVLVGVLQGDDLVQMQNASCQTPHRRSLRRSAAQAVRALYPNLMALARGPRPECGPREIGPVWKEQAAKIVGTFDAAERRRFEQLDAEIRGLFFRGELNPPLIEAAVRNPGWLMTGAGLNPTTGGGLVEAVAACLLRIREAAARVKAPVIVMSVPFGAYVNARAWRARRRLGFEVDERLLNSTGPDDLIRAAAAAARLPFVTATDQFRREVEREDLFFPLDGHLTAAGTRLYGRAIAGTLTPVLQGSHQKTPR